MARSEKDRALLFSGSGVRDGRCPSGRFYFVCLSSGDGVQACPARGFGVRSLRVYPDIFIDRVSPPLFIARIFVTFFGCFSVAQPETDVIMNGGLVQVHKLYIIFHIRRLICCIQLSSKEAHESCHATSRVLTHGHVTWLGRQCIVQVSQAGRAHCVPSRFHRHHRHEPSRLLSSWAGLAYPVGLRVGPARAYGVACPGSP